MKRPFFLSLVLLVSALPQTAVAADDPRLVERPYQPDQIVLIEGRVNVQATIVFGDDELIENVAIGDSGSWQVTPNKRANLLFVKPLDNAAATNMTVITNRRTYLFDLVARPRAQALYMLRFTYPDEPADEAPKALADAPNAIEQAAANDPHAVIDPAALNFAWGHKGDAALLPAEIFDDGESTFLSWPAGAPVPAILMTNLSGQEGPVNYTVRGDTVVVDGVPAKLILRSGKDVVVLTYQGPAGTGGGKAFARTEGGK